MDDEDIPPLPIPLEKWNRLAKSLQLPPQQRRIVELILRNRSDKQIAAEMNLGLPTVRTYVGRVFRRIHVRDRRELALRLCAMSHGICRDGR